MKQRFLGFSGRQAAPDRRWLAIGALVLAGIVLPFLFFGAAIEAAVAALLQGAGAEPGLAAAAVMLLLAADIVLPVPSSLVGAFAGAVLGLAAGVAATWAGLMLGCAAGYGIGRAMAGRRPPGEAAARGGAIGPAALAATRAVPVLAEAGIIAAGAAGIGFARMLAIVAPANLAVAFAYAAAGRLLAGIDPGLAAVGACLLCAAAWMTGALLRRHRAGR